MKGLVVPVLVLFFITLLCPFNYTFNQTITKSEALSVNTLHTHEGSILGSYIYENKGQFNIEHVLYYGRIAGGFVGFCQSQILSLNSNGNVVASYSFDPAVNFEVIASENSYATNFFLGSRGTFLNIESFKSIRYLNSNLNLELVAKLGISGIVLVVKSCSSFFNIHTIHGTTHFVKDDSLVLKYEMASIEQIDALDSEYISESIDSQPCNGNLPQSALLQPIIFSSYFGGDGSDYASSIELDEDENIYVGGNVDPVIPYNYSIGFPGESTNFQAPDIAIMKLNPQGNGIQWITYIGGSHIESWPRLAYFQNSLYISGETWSEDFPLSNPYQSTHGGGAVDAFLLRLNSTGNGLIFSTYLGGDEREEYVDIATDPQGDVVLTGRSGSGNFPILNGFDTDKDPTDEVHLNREVFVSKFNKSGWIQFSTFLRGDDSGSSAPGGITTDENGDIYITGASREMDFPCTDGCNFRTSENGYATFVAKISANGSALMWSALFGPSYSGGGDIAVSSDGSVYVVGNIGSSSILLVNPFDDTFNYQYPTDDEHEVFIIRLSSSGNRLLYSSYLGGDDSDYVGAIQIDSQGFVYVVGITTSNNFPRTFPYSLNQSVGGSIFALKFNWDLQSLLFSLTLPGSQSSHPYDMCVDSSGRIHLVGFTWSTEFPLVNSIQEEYSEGEPDWFITIFRDLNDRDYDGLDDMEEAQLGTDIYNFDSDFDKLPDGWEVYYGLNPLSDQDALSDLDEDNLSNEEEYFYGTDPTNIDSDFDNYTDGWEIANGYNPLDPETPSSAELLQAPTLIVISSIGLISIVILINKRNSIKKVILSRFGSST